MVFIFIRAKITPSTQVEFHQLSGGLRGMKEPVKWYFFHHIRGIFVPSLLVEFLLYMKGFSDQL
jgi:hypothetical protein